MGRMSDDELRRILDATRTIAMIGASADSERDSHRVMRYLQQHGFRVVPVNPTVEEGTMIHGERVRAGLADIPETFELVDVFRKPAAVAGVVDEVLALDRRPQTLWLQLGVVDEDAAEAACRGGLDVVMDRCIMQEHRRLYG